MSAIVAFGSSALDTFRTVSALSLCPPGQRCAAMPPKAAIIANENRSAATRERIVHRWEVVFEALTWLQYLPWSATVLGFTAAEAAEVWAALIADPTVEIDFRGPGGAQRVFVEVERSMAVAREVGVLD